MTYTVVEPTRQEHRARYWRKGRWPMKGTLRQCNVCGARVWAGLDQQNHTRWIHADRKESK